MIPWTNKLWAHFKQVFPRTRSAALILFVWRYVYPTIATIFFFSWGFPRSYCAWMASKSCSLNSGSATQAGQSSFAGFNPTNFKFRLVAFAAIGSWLSFQSKEFREWQKLFTRDAILAARIMWSSMNFMVLAAGDKLQIRRIVVPRTAIFVMDFFGFAQRSSKNLFHENAMFKSLLPFEVDQSVAGWGKGSTPIGSTSFSCGPIKSPSSVVHVAPTTALGWTVAQSYLAKFHGATTITRSYQIYQAELN